MADSRQAYSGLHIATNHPPDEYRAAVPYHGIEFADPARTVVNAHDFLTVANAAIASTQDRGVPIVVEGGTMLWVDALTEGFDLAGVPPDPGIRALPLQEAVARVRSLDPEARLDFQNPRRVARALEILEALGPPLDRHRGRARPPWRFRRFGLMATLEVIERRLHDRCLEQVRRGLVAETREALARGVPRDHPVLTGIGYAQALDFIEGRITEAELPVRMLQANRRYAKRQLSWFRRHAATTWVEAEPDPVPGILSLLETAT